MSNEDLIKGDQNNQSDDKSTKDEMVPKSDYDSLQTKLNETSKSVETMKKQLDEAKLAVLDPEYLRWQENKMTKDDTKGASEDTSTQDLENMSRKDFFAYVTDHTVNELVSKLSPAIEGKLSKLSMTVNDLAARDELKETRQKYPDFNDFKDDVREIISMGSKRNINYTFEDAYKIAVSNRHIAKTKDQKEAEIRAGKEKPDGIAPESTSPKQFKSKADAAEDAWSRAVGSDKTTL